MVLSVDITQLELGTPKGTDVIPGVDILDLKQSSSGTTKKYTIASEFNYTLNALGQKVFPACVVASTANFIATYNNGFSGVGATLTNATSQTPFTCDGISAGDATNPLRVGDRVLIKNQSDEKQNGIYTLFVAGSNLSNWVLQRATDYDQGSEIAFEDTVLVTRGVVNAGIAFQQENDGPFTIGASNIAFAPYMFRAFNFNSINGTANRIDVTQPSLGNFYIDISPLYIGQTSINVVGVITSGTWNGTVVDSEFGGTGLNNNGLTIDLSNGVSGYIMVSDVAGNASWDDHRLHAVTSAKGTIHQITVNGLLTPQRGDITIGAAQDIDTVSSPTFANLFLSNDIQVTGNGIINGTLEVDGDVQFNSALLVQNGPTTLNGNTFITGPLVLSGSVTVNANVTVNGTLHITGAVTFDSTLHTIGAVTFDNILNVTGATTLSSTLHVVGIVTLDTNLNVGGNGVFTGTLLASNLSGTNTGDVTLLGENYLTISSQVITAHPINLSGSNVTSTLGVTNGGTGTNTTFTQYSIVTVGASGIYTQVLNSSTIGFVLSSTATQPQWSRLTDLLGIVDLAHGGTGQDLSAAPDGQILYKNGTVIGGTSNFVIDTTLFNLTLTANRNSSLLYNVANPNSGASALSKILVSNDGVNAAYFYLNSSTNSTDGAANSATLRNDAGDLRLLSGNASGQIFITSGNATPSSNGLLLSTVQDLNLRTSKNSSLTYTIANSNSGASAFSRLSLTNNSSSAEFFINSSGNSSDGPASSATLRNNAGQLRVISLSSSTVQLSCGAPASTTDGLTIGTSQNLSLFHTTTSDLNYTIWNNSSNAGASTTMFFGNDTINTVQMTLNSSANTIRAGTNGFRIENYLGNLAFIASHSGANIWLTTGSGTPGTDGIILGTNQSLTLKTSINSGLISSVVNTNAGSSAFAEIRVANDSLAGAYLYINSSTNSSDGAANSATLRNDIGDMRLLSGSGSGQIYITAGGATPGTTGIILNTSNNLTLVNSLTGIGTGGVIFVAKNTNSSSTSYTLLGVANDSGNGCNLFLNSSTRSGDGATNGATLRNDIGQIRIQSSIGGNSGILIDTNTNPNMTFTGICLKQSNVMVSADAPCFQGVKSRAGGPISVNDFASSFEGWFVNSASATVLGFQLRTQVNNVTAGSENVFTYITQKCNSGVDTLVLQFSNTGDVLTYRSLIVGNSAITTGATDGFLYLPTCNGTPTGTPTTHTGTCALVYDTSANKIWVYNGSWRGIVVI